MRIHLDAMHLYYLPQYLPVIRELSDRGATAELVFYRDPDPRNHQAALADDALDRLAAEAGCGFHVMPNLTAGRDYHRQRRPDWVIYGNGLKSLDLLPSGVRTAMLYHGIGVKSIYYHPRQMMMDLRFTEGPYRLQALRKRYPDTWIEAVGFPKLDPLFNAAYPLGKFTPEAVGLRSGRPLVLYAPTFYPSSVGCLPRDWPQQLAGCNIVIKPHQFLYTHRKYRHEMRRLERWSQCDNVHLVGPAECNILPLMEAADLLISEASSVLFEFAALDKPVIWCDFVRPRLSHRITPSKWRKLIDPEIDAYRSIARHAAEPGALADVVRGQLANPGELSAERRRITAELIGPTDGKASARVVNCLLA